MAASYFLVPKDLLLTTNSVDFEPCTSSLMRLRFWPVGLASVVAEESNAEVDRFLLLPGGALAAVMELGCRTDKVGSAFLFPGVQVATMARPTGFREERSALKYGAEEFFFVSGWFVGTTGSLNTKGIGWCLDTGMGQFATR